MIERITMSDKNVRRAAVSALRAWSKGHAYADSLIDRHTSRNHLSREDRALLNAIVLGVLRNRRLLDHWISKLRKGKLDHETRDILRVGLCQLLILGIPEHAAVNETVNCARSAARGLVNAVMRRAAKTRSQMLADAEDLAPPVRYSHPDWLWKRWQKTWGKEKATALLQWDQEPAPVILRENPLRPAPAPTTDLMPVPGQDGFFESTGEFPHQLIEAGHYYVQDPSTALAPRLLAPRPGERVLDACSAPGGKAALMAGLMENTGTLVCTDSNEKRLPRLSENFNRLGVTIAQAEVFDWSHPAPDKWRQHFDAILLDVPCSNTGVLRRRVDARWRLQVDQLEALVKLQHTILQNALACLKPDGRLVYSTCSIDPEENSGQMERFLTAQPGWELVESHQLVPFKDEVDGAYAVLLQAR